MASFKTTLHLCLLLAALAMLSRGFTLPPGDCRVPLSLAQYLRLARRPPSDVNHLTSILRRDDVHGAFLDDLNGNANFHLGGPGVDMATCPDRLRVNGSLAERSTCPWVLTPDEDRERVPSRMIKAAPCTYNCIKVTDEQGSERAFSFGVCEPVFWNVRVVRRRCNQHTGRYEYEPDWEKVPVAFTCAFPKKQRDERITHAQVPFGPTQMI